MSKITPREPEYVKLQIPVSAELADELATWAKKAEYTQARLCAVLLNLALDDLSNIGDWLKARAVGKRQPGYKRGWLQRSDNSAVRLQVPVPQELADRIEALATRLNHTPVRMAALVLDFGLADDKWFLHFLSTRIGKLYIKLFGKKPEVYESAEITEGEVNE